VLHRFLDIAREGVVRVLASTSERVDQAIVGPVVDAISREDGGVAAGGGVLARQPHAVLARRWRIRQHVNGRFNRDGADPLQAPPGLDAEVGRICGQLMNE
jgi:hypothetical protein